MSIECTGSRGARGGWPRPGLDSRHESRRSAKRNHRDRGRPDRRRRPTRDGPRSGSLCALGSASGLRGESDAELPCEHVRCRRAVHTHPSACRPATGPSMRHPDGSGGSVPEYRGPSEPRPLKGVDNIARRSQPSAVRRGRAPAVGSGTMVARPWPLDRLVEPPVHCRPRPRRGRRAPAPLSSHPPFRARVRCEHARTRHQHHRTAPTTNRHAIPTTRPSTWLHLVFDSSHRVLTMQEWHIRVRAWADPHDDVPAAGRSLSAAILTHCPPDVRPRRERDAAQAVTHAAAGVRTHVSRSHPLLHS